MLNLSSILSWLYVVSLFEGTSTTQLAVSPLMLRHTYRLIEVATSLKSLRRRDLGLRAASAWPALARLFAAVCRPALVALEPIACTTGRVAGQVYNT